MASKKQIEANRRNARKSTGPRTPEGKAVSSRNAIKHGFTSDQALDERETAAMEARRVAWSKSLAPDDDPLKLDLVALAVRNYHRILRIDETEAAEAEHRARHADLYWERERLERLSAAIAKLETDRRVANLELESLVAGCDWKIEAIESVLKGIEMKIWDRDAHELFRSLLSFSAGDPKGLKRLPDLWFQKVFRYEEAVRYCDTPIAELPWEERVMTAKKLNDAYRHDEELLDRLKTEAWPYAEAYHALGRSEIERLKALRDRLVPLEAEDRARFAARLAAEESPGAAHRLRYRKDSERGLVGCLREIREIAKFVPPAPPDPPVSPDSLDPEASPDAPDSPSTSRNEPNFGPPERPIPPNHRPPVGLVPRIVRNLKGIKPPSQRRR